MNDHDKVQTSSKRETKSAEKLSLPPSSNLRKNQSLKSPSKFSTQRNRPNPTKKQSSSNPTCTRCGCTHLIDITQHEFPKQKGLLFECASCGNNSIRSNVSVDEHKRRLAKVAADHLNKVECQFCHRQFHSHNDYIVHLRDDHESNKPM